MRTHWVNMIQSGILHGHDLMKVYVWTSFSDIPCEHDQMIAYQVNMIQRQHTKWTWSSDSIPNDPDPIWAYWTNMICWGHTKWTWSIEDIITEWLWSYEYIHSEDDLMRTYWVNIIWWEHTEWTWSDDSIPSEYDEENQVNTMSVTIHDKIPQLCLDIESHCYCHYATYTNPLFLHQAWLLLTVYLHTQFGCKSQWYRKYRTDKHSIKFWATTVTMFLNTTMLFLPQNTPVYDDAPSNPVWLQKGQQLSRHSRNDYILIIWVLTVTLVLMITKQAFYSTLLLMMIQYHTKFGYKRLNGSEDTGQTNSQWSF